MAPRQARDELAAVHSITSSAQASSLGMPGHLSLYRHAARLDSPVPLGDLGGDEFGKVFRASALGRCNILTLPGLPWSPKFMEAYEAPLIQAAPVVIGARRTKPGSPSRSTQPPWDLRSANVGTPPAPSAEEKF